MIAKPAIWVIRVYKRTLSPMLPPSCRFSPSCSQYTLQALEKYGLIKEPLSGYTVCCAAIRFLEEGSTR